MPEKLPPMVRADMRRARSSWIKAAADRTERRERRRSDFLAYIDGDGRVVDFHALRATYITMLVRSGASVKEAQELARHSDPKLTMNVYTKLGISTGTGMGTSKRLNSGAFSTAPPEERGNKRFPRSNKILKASTYRNSVHKTVSSSVSVPYHRGIWP